METTKKVNTIIENNKKVFIIPKDDFTQKCFAGDIKVLYNNDIETCNFIADTNQIIEVNLPNCISFGGDISGNQLKTLNMPICRYIGSSAFRYIGVKNLSLPYCSYIGASAFYGAEIEIIDLPECTQIAADGFANNKNLKYINLPKLTSITNSVFASCTSLENAIFPTVSSIYSYAFQHCSNLSSLTLASTSVRFGASNCFIGCLSLETLAFPNAESIANISSMLLNSTPIYNSTILGYFGSIYVPNNMVSVLKTASGWSYFSDRITSIDNLPIK